MKTQLHWVPKRLLAVVALLSISVGLCSSTQQTDKTQAVPAKGVAKQPTILLTGFEPFGKSKPPNPSWESIKDLDGTQWKEFRLVSRQLPVIWGSPLEKLPVWISECEPAAVFSFGQGGGFAVETRASNDRGGNADNDGKRAADPKIAADGPAQYQTSTDGQKIASMLTDKGWKVRVSTSAGKYLCEECLYSLEHVKATKQFKGTVMFCHVPPLGATVGDKKVTPEYVQMFVKDVLESWHKIYQSPATPVSTPETPEQAAKAQDTKDVKELINRYFSTWSNQDMKGYEACFLPEACIQHIDDGGGLSTSMRKEFIDSQRDYHKSSPYKTTEVPESVDVTFEAKLARAVVFWKLTAGPRSERGYDHFTLVKHEGQWRIVNLVFYSADKKLR